ncbi:MAG: NUDIX hydrolase [Thermoleophilia bacterium]
MSETRGTGRSPDLRVAALIVSEGRVLLVRQAKGGRQYWLLPGGGVERGETLAEALVRELREECGLSISVIEPPYGLVQAISPDGGKTRHLVQLIYRARVERADPSGKARPLSEREKPAEVEQPKPSDPVIQQVAWLGSEKLEDLKLHPPLQDLIRLELAGQGAPSPGDSGLRLAETFLDAGVRWQE